MKITPLAAAAALLISLFAPAHAGPPAGDHDFGITVGMSQGRLGAQVQTLTPELREFFGAPKDAGILVGSVAKDSAAAKAGLRVGDVITRVAGQAIEAPWDVMSALAGKAKGDLVELTIVRGKKTQSLKATLTDEGFGFGGNLGATFGKHGLRVDPNFDLHIEGLDGLGDLLGDDAANVRGLIKKLAPFVGDQALEDKLEKAARRLEELEKRLEALEKK